MLKQLFTDVRFYLFLLLVSLAGGATLLGINDYFMPRYTNYNEGLTVPDITKLSIEEAQQTLRRFGLRDSIIDKRYNASFPANYVIDQAPAPSTIVKPNRKVYLTVNTSVTPKVSVPNLANLSLRNAELQLKNYGLKVGNVSYISSPFKNSVMSQSIAAGTQVERGSIVSLVISDGLGINKVAVPKLKGLRLPVAQAQLRSVGLRIGEIRFRPSFNDEANTILEFFPADRDSLVEGSTIDLVVAEQARVEEVIEKGAVIIDSTRVDTTGQNRPKPQ